MSSGSKQNIGKKITNFIEGKGFYIILFLCLAAIGISGYVVLIRPSQNLSGVTPQDFTVPDISYPDLSGTDSNTPTYQPYNPPDAATTGGYEEVPAEEVSSVNTPAVPDTPKTQTPESNKSEDKKPDTASKEPKTMNPVTGEVACIFSGDGLVYNPTTGDWRTHSGIDILCEEGTAVVAYASGTVEGVFPENQLGCTVVVDHGNGLKTVYANLSTDGLIAPGKTISAGTKLGMVGNTSIVEAGQPSHLHLEFILDGKPVDPDKYLK